MSDSLNPQKANAGALGPVNSTVLLVSTLSGTWATVYGDLFPSSSVFHYKGWMALGWVIAVLTTLYVAGYAEAPSGTTHKEKFSRGWKVARSNPGYGFLLLFMSVAAVFCVWGKTKPEGETKSLLVSLVKKAEQTEAYALEAKVAAQSASYHAQRADVNTESILNDTSEIKGVLNKPLSAQERMARKGVQWTGNAFGEALLNSDVDTVRDFVEGGWNVLSGFEEGNAIGHYANRSNVQDVDRTVQILKILSAKIDLDKPLGKFRGFPPLNFATNALMGCNLGMLKALNQSGVNIRRIQNYELKKHWGSDYYQYNPIQSLINSDGKDCPHKKTILALMGQ